MVRSFNFIEALVIDATTTASIITIADKIEEEVLHLELLEDARINSRSYYYEYKNGFLAKNDMERGVTISTVENKICFLKKQLFYAIKGLNKTYHEVTGKYFMMKVDICPETYDKCFKDVSNILSKIA